MKRRALHHECIPGLLLIALLAGWLSTAFAETTHFSVWSFDLPEGMTVAEQSPTKLVLRANPVQGARSQSSITLFAALSIDGDSNDWLDQRWQQIKAGRTITYEAEPGQAALMDGTGGLRRSANAGDGSIMLQADLFEVDGKVAVLLTDARDEAGFAAYLNLLFSLTIDQAPIEDFASVEDIESAVESTELADVGSPAPLGRDPYDSIDWDGPDVVIRTSADLDEIDVDVALEIFLAKNKSLLGGSPAAPVSFQVAMHTVSELVGVEKNAGYLDQLRTLPSLQNVDVLITFANSQLALGDPAQALASLWVAQQRWPQDANVLFNMAGLLAGQGFINQSQAILHEIKHRGTPPAIGFGISSQAGVDYVEGFNLMNMGEYDEASTKLQAALSAAPDLAEAALSLALVEDHLGRPAKKLFLQGYFRRSVKTMQTEPSHNYDMLDETQDADAQQADIDTEELDGIIALPAIYFVDLSKGQPGILPYIDSPDNVDDALAYWRWLGLAHPAMFAKETALGERRDALDEKWRNNLLRGSGIDPRVTNLNISTETTGPSESWRRYEYYEAILRIFSEANARLPELRPLIAAREESEQRLSDADAMLAERFYVRMAEIERRAALKPPIPPCPDILVLVAETHAKLMEHVKKVDIDTRRAHHLWHRYATALGGMVHDPDFRAYLQSDVEMADEVEYGGLIFNMLQATRYSEFTAACRALEQQERDEEAMKKAEVAPCDEKNKVTKGVIVGPLTLESNCEGFALRATNDLLGPLKFTGEVTFDRDGWVKGDKIGVEVDVGAGKASGEVSRDKGGNFKEVKIGGEVDVLGPYTVKGEVSRDDKGSTTIYSGTKTGGTAEAGPFKVSGSSESGSGVTTDKFGNVTNTFSKTVQQSSGEFFGVGVSTSNSNTVNMPAPSAHGG